MYILTYVISNRVVVVVVVLRASTIGFPYEKAEGVPKCARVYEEACKNIATSYLPAYVRYCLLFKTSRKTSQPVLSIYARRPSSFSGWAESYAEDKANSFPCSPKTWSSIMSSLSPSLSSKPIALLADLINGGPNQILSERLSLLEGKERKREKTRQFGCASSRQALIRRPAFFRVRLLKFQTHFFPSFHLLASA